MTKGAFATAVILSLFYV